MPASSHGVQFHPEVHHTVNGIAIIQNFLFRVCGCSPTWTMGSFIEENIQRIREQVGNERVICGLSGGVDSSVLAVLLHKAIGKKLTSIFVDNGLLRENEVEEVVSTFRDQYHLNFRLARAGERFLKKLAGVTDPERKRKIIGREFIAVFDEEAKKLGRIKFLAQGTLYPDVIESHLLLRRTVRDIKSHHNVGGLPEAHVLSSSSRCGCSSRTRSRLGRELGLRSLRQPASLPGTRACHPRPAK